MKTPKTKRNRTAPSRSVQRLVRATPPCKQKCPKCGAADVYRDHRMPGALEVSATTRGIRRKNEFVKIDGWDSDVIKECIRHHCRTCQYDWETAPLRCPNGDSATGG